MDFVKIVVLEHQIRVYLIHYFVVFGEVVLKNRKARYLNYESINAQYMWKSRS